MALYYVNVKTFNRSRGQSAVNAAAYRAGQSFYDERTGLTHSYSKKGGVLDVVLTAPPGAPAWCADPPALWNEAERAERKNGRPAREVLVALPAELTTLQSSDLARSITQHLVDRYRVAAMTCIHAPDRKGDQRNVHAHILITTREVGPNGLGRKTRVLDDRTTGPTEVAAIRAAVARLTNEHLARAGYSARVDHASLAKQSLAAEKRGDFATAIRFIRAPLQHEGQAATAARRRGEQSLVVENNSRIRNDNAALQKLFLSKVRSIVMPSRGNVGGVAWATGHDADLLNGQAQSLRDSARMEADMSHAYQAMIADVVRDLGARATPLIDYAQLRHLTLDETRELARHARNPLICAIAKNVVRADRSRQHFQKLEARRRNRHTRAIVRTNQAECALRYTEQEVPRNKREWAKLRREQRAALEAAKRNEKRADKITSHDAERRVSARTGAVQERIDFLEAERRRRFPISSDRKTAPASSSNEQAKQGRTPLDWLPNPSRERRANSPRPH